NYGPSVEKAGCRLSRTCTAMSATVKGQAALRIRSHLLFDNRRSICDENSIVKFRRGKLMERPGNGNYRGSFFLRKMMNPRVSPAGATLLLAVAMALPAGSAFAKSACDGVTTTLTRQVKLDYRSLIAHSLGKKVKPASVNIESFMQYGDWSVVYADVPVADPGYFFFDLSGKSPELE